MNKDELIEFIGSLGLIKGEFVLFGGSSLTIRGLRPAGDLDIFVTKKQYDKLAEQGWKPKSQNQRTEYLVNEFNGFEVQVFHKWEGEGWQPDVKSYLSNPEVVLGLPFMPLKELYKWKNITRRPKDLEDLKLMHRYWESGGK